MATELKKVERGDLIESSLINLIIDKIMELSGGVQTGSVTVPYLFGKTISQAKTIINLPPNILSFGNVVDAFGVALDPDLSANNTRLIVNQVPDPGARVSPGSFVDLLVAATPSAGGTPPPPPVPTINTVNPFVPAKVPIGQDVTINGNNFALDIKKNKVTFDGVPQTGDPSPESSKTKLVVKVPAISNPPTTGQEKEVTVIVEADGVKSAGVKLILLPPLAGTNPTITTIGSSSPSFARVGEIITINGTGFNPTTLAQNVISFALVDTAVTATPELTGNTALLLRVKVPPMSGASGPQSFVDVSIFVTVGGKKSNVIGGFTVGGPA